MRGASKGEGLGNQFLANIREVDAVAHVLRCFEDPDVVHVEGTIDPVADAETVETELMLADLESLERRIQPLRKKATGKDKEALALLPVMEKALATLTAGKPARVLRRELAPEDIRVLDGLQLLTAKPVLYVANVAEADAATGNAHSARVAAMAAEQGAGFIVISAAIEAEIAQLPRGEPRIPGRDRARGARPRPADPRRLRASRPRHLLHRRAEGGARLDRRRRAPRRRRRQA